MKYQTLYLEARSSEELSIDMNGFFKDTATDGKEISIRDITVLTEMRTNKFGGGQPHVIFVALITYRVFPSAD